MYQMYFNCIWHVLCKYFRCIGTQNKWIIHGHCRHFDRISLKDVLVSSMPTNTTWIHPEYILITVPMHPKTWKPCIIQIQYISITSKQSIVHHDQAWVHLTLHHSIHPSLSHYIMIRVSLHPIILALITSHWHHIGYHSLSLSSTAAQPLAVWLAGHCRGCRVGHHYCRARSTAGRGDTAGPGETAGRGDKAGPPAKLEVSISSFASGNLKSLAASSGNRAASHGDWASIAYL